MQPHGDPRPETAGTAGGHDWLPCQPRPYLWKETLAALPPPNSAAPASSRRSVAFHREPPYQTALLPLDNHSFPIEADPRVNHGIQLNTTPAFSEAQKLPLNIREQLQVSSSTAPLANHHAGLHCQCGWCGTCRTSQRHASLHNPMLIGVGQDAPRCMLERRYYQRSSRQASHTHGGQGLCVTTPSFDEIRDQLIHESLMHAVQPAPPIYYHRGVVDITS